MNQKIAVLGLGKMGSSIASRLLDCGFEVLIWNRSRGREATLLSKGAIWAENPAAAALEAQVVISMVSDDAASAAVWLGEAGAMAKMQPGAIMIECSTVSYEHVAIVSGEAKRRGIIYLDCPVTGWPEHAAAGKLTLLLGADPEDMEAAKPVLSGFSNKIRYFGAVGCGTAYKLMINLMGAVQIAALGEGLALADKLGLDKQTVVEAIIDGAAASPQVVRNAHRMLSQNFADNPTFTVGLRYKDAAYGVSLAKSVKSQAPLGEAALKWFAAASGTESTNDESAIIKVVNSNGER